MSNDKCVVKYLRLSLEDDDILDESNSITNQRIVIGQYIASKNEFKKCGSVRIQKMMAIVEQISNAQDSKV